MVVTSLMILALISGGQDQLSEQDRQPRHWPGAAWVVRPMPELSGRETGPMQVEVTCTFVAPDRVQNCRVSRRLPGRFNFGRAVLRSLPRARVVQGQMQTGDTFTFTIWICMPAPTEGRCMPVEWPEP